MIRYLDKGKGTAVLYKHEYSDKIHSVINDTTKFEQIQYNQTDLQMDHHQTLKAEWYI